MRETGASRAAMRGGATFDELGPQPRVGGSVQQELAFFDDRVWTASNGQAIPVLESKNSVINPHTHTPHTSCARLGHPHSTTQHGYEGGFGQLRLGAVDEQR